MSAIITAAAAVTAGPLIAGSAAVLLSAHKQKNTGRTAGLLLHSIDESVRLSMSSYPKKRFEQLLDYLKNNNIETITLSEHFTSSTTPPSSIVITFDDGLQSFYDNAYPLLEAKTFKATVFAVAGTVGKTGAWDVMGQTRHMTAGMLREIADAGHEIGSHSLTHANLIWLNDNDLMKELQNSKTILEDITGKPIKSVSFPFGSWNRRVWDMAKYAGYKYATAYRGHKHILPGMLPVLGGYQFDSATDLIERLSPTNTPASHTSKTLAQIMSHFSKGSPMVMFRKEYV